MAESRKSSARSSSRAETTLDLANPSDLQPKSPQSAESTPRILQKQIDKAIGDHRTQSSMINAVVGGVSTQGNQLYHNDIILQYCGGSTDFCEEKLFSYNLSLS